MNYIVKNNKLFNNDTFYCCLCGMWKPRSAFLYEAYKKYENTNYITQMVTEVKHFHFGFNYKRAIQETPAELPNFNLRALTILLNNKECVTFLKENNIKPDDINRIKEITPDLKKLTLKLFGGIVWK